MGSSIARWLLSKECVIEPRPSSITSVGAGPVAPNPNSAP